VKAGIKKPVKKKLRGTILDEGGYSKPWKEKWEFNLL